MKDLVKTADVESSHEARRVFWLSHIEKWLEDEHCSQQEYCHRHNLSISSFSRWKNKLKPKLHRKKVVSRKAKYWRIEVDNWIKATRQPKKKSLSLGSQSYYCMITARSESSFSRWKNRFYPELKHKRLGENEVTDTRLKGLSNKSFKAMVSGFIDQDSPRNIAQKMGVSLKTCYKYLKIVESRFVLGAMQHPAIFNGAGVMLFFGPPPIIHETLIEKYKKRGRKPSQKTFSKLLKESVFFNSMFDWTSDEIWNFYAHGWCLFFDIVYKSDHGVDGYFNEKHRRYIRAQYSESDMIGKLWNKYLQSGFEEILPMDYWHAIYHTHKHRNAEQHRRQMIFDLTWILKKYHPLKRNTYWDENFPKPSENYFIDVARRIENSHKLLYGK